MVSGYIFWIRELPLTNFKTKVELPLILPLYPRLTSRIFIAHCFIQLPGWVQLFSIYVDIISNLIFTQKFLNYKGCYIAVKGRITVYGAANRDKYKRTFVLKNWAPFTSCTSKINITLKDNAEDLDIVM